MYLFGLDIVTNVIYLVSRENTFYWRIGLVFVVLIIRTSMPCLKMYVSELSQVFFTDVVTRTSNVNCNTILLRNNL